MKKNKITALSRITKFLVMAAVSLFTDCSAPNREADKEEQKSIAIDDSIRHQSPHARKMIADAMRTARDSTEYYSHATRLGFYFTLSPTPDSALTWLAQSEAFARRNPSDKSKLLLIKTYNAQAAYYHHLHINTDKSIALYEKSYRLMMESGHNQEAHNVCANLGDAYIYKDRLYTAASWYRRALFLTDSLRLPIREKASLYTGLAYIYRLMGDNEQALKAYQSADKYFDEMTTTMQANFINNYAVYYYYQKNYRRSEQLYHRLERFLTSHGLDKSVNMSLCHLNLADIYLNLGNTKLATQYLNKVEPFWVKMGDPTALYYITTIRLGIAVTEGNVTEAGRILQAEKHHGDTGQDMRHIRNRYLRRYYELRGDWRNAYHNLQNDVHENDSLEHRLMKMRSSDIMAQYAQDTLRLHNSLALERKAAEVRNTRTWLAIAIAAALLLTATWIQLARRRKRKAIEEIMQLKLKGARSKISPHFVFNVINNQIADTSGGSTEKLLELSKLIRANLDIADQMTISLTEELAFAQKYVNVEKELLLDDDFTYSVQLADDIDADKLTVPSMFIQIMVENAFVHGLMGRQGHKQLTITASREGCGVAIAVRDNGPGFDIRRSRKGRTGMNIIRLTMTVINQTNWHKMDFGLRNIPGPDGKNAGCEARLFIPNDIKYPK